MSLKPGEVLKGSFCGILTCPHCNTHLQIMLEAGRTIPSHATCGICGVIVELGEFTTIYDKDADSVGKYTLEEVMQS